MANVLARGVVSILAVAASLSPSFACGGEETWLTDKEIAIAKAGGPVPVRNFDVHYIEPTLPDIPFTSSVVVEDLGETDTIVDAQSQLFVAAHRPLDIALTAVAPQVEYVAPSDEQERTSPSTERAGLKHVILACGGGVMVLPNAS
jgi:hypothetical protein